MNEQSSGHHLCYGEDTTPDNVLGVGLLHISSKSVHFRRSCGQTPLKRAVN